MQDLSQFLDMPEQGHEQIVYDHMPRQQDISEIEDDLSCMASRTVTPIRGTIVRNISDLGLSGPISLLFAQISHLHRRNHAQDSSHRWQICCRH